MSKEDSTPKCIGIWGKMFGHKFSDMLNYFQYCQRCGMPKGGWK